MEEKRKEGAIVTVTTVHLSVCCNWPVGHHRAACCSAFVFRRLLSSAPSLTSFGSWHWHLNSLTLQPSPHHVCSTFWGRHAGCSCNFLQAPKFKRKISNACRGLALHRFLAPLSIFLEIIKHTFFPPTKMWPFPGHVVHSLHISLFLSLLIGFLSVFTPCSAAPPAPSFKKNSPRPHNPSRGTNKQHYEAVWGETQMGFSSRGQIRVFNSYLMMSLLFKQR